MENITTTEFHMDVMELVAKYILDTKDVTISFEKICEILNENQSSILSSSKSNKDISSH